MTKLPKVITLFCCLFLALANAFAGSDTYRTGLRGAGIAVNSQILTQDVWYDHMQSNSDWYNYAGGGLDYSRRFANVAATGRVRLQYDGTEHLFYTNPWELVVGYRVQAFAADGSLLLDRDDELRLRYDPAYNGGQVDIAVLEYPGAHRLQIDLTSVSDQPNGQFTLADDFILEGSVEVERYFTLNPSVVPFSSHRLLNANPSGEHTTIQFFWSFAEGAEEYELQYQYVSDELIDGQSPADQLDFREATRIMTPRQQFRLIPAYESGSIFYRVRSIGRHGDDFKHRHLGAWSVVQEIVLDETLTTGVDILAYESAHNWTQQVTHFGDGKYQVAVGFFDGSGRSRQSVSYDLDNKIAHVQESMVDQEGRPAVDVMSTPVLPATLSASNLDVESQLRFYDNFTLAHGTTTPYDESHFDLDANRDNPLGINATIAEKAGSYYSSANPLKDYSFHRYLPDAATGGNGSFGYIRTLYDKYGRLKEQSGVGEEYHLAAGRTMKYYYGTPSQQKLDRLFGTEVGYAEHYRKRMTQDPNGQLTVSYEKLDGQVIATALVGYVPSVMVGGEALPLVDEVSTADGIIGNLTEELDNHNEYLEGSQEWELLFTKLVSTPGPYNFHYDLDLTDAQYAISCGDNVFGASCKYELDIRLLDADDQVVNFTGTFSASVVDVNGNVVTAVDQNSFPVQVSFGNDYDLDFTAIFAEVGNYTIVKTLGLISTEAALANYEAFLLDPSNDCLSPGNILSDCEGINYVEDGTFFPSNGADCASLLDVFRGDLSPGGQYFDNLLGGVEDPATVNDWLGGVGYAGPNVLAPDNSLVTTSDFATLEGLIDAAVENITIGSVAEGWNAFRDYWDLPEVQDHLFGTGSGDWGLHRYHPEYGHYEWCVDLQNSVPNNGQSSGEFDQSLLTYATTFDPWITELQNSNCPSQAANYQIVNADPYFSSTLGSRPVNGNGLNGKELMRELLCTYPEQSVQSLPTNTLWAAAVEAADAEVGGMATTAQVWEVFAAYYVQQKRRVMDLQKKNPCDSDKYSPFLFDASTANNAADLVADLPREHAFNYWGNSTYDVGSGTQPATGLHPVYDNWDQSCAIQTSSIAQVSTLLSNWSYGDNEQLRVTDERARGFMIRIPDMERVAQDLVDDGMNDGIFGESDDWTELEQMISNTNPCLNGASVLMAHSAYDIVFPTNASSIVIQLEKIIRYWDQQSSPADCIPINSDPWNCSNSVDFTVTYYSMEDFYWANQAFFDCMVATVNDFVSTPYDFQAVHTPTHFVISSPTHANLIPNGAVFTTYNNCTDCLENFGGSNSEGTSGGENGAASRSRSGNNLSNGQGLNATRSGACFEFWNPCDQIVPHCLCEDLQAATAQTASGTTAQIAALYAEEYGALPADWESFIDVLATQCNTIIYSATATEEAQVAAEELIEDLADGIVSLPTSPNAPAPIGLDCFTYEPDPCDEGQTIADYYNEQIYQDQFNALLEEFAQNYSANCLSPDEAPDALEMTYEDREYHFTLYYYSPEGNLYATVPPEGVRPISDADPTVFEQIANYRTNGWGSGFTVPQHRRNLGRANQLMTLYEYDSYNNPVVSQMPELRGTTTEMDNLPAYGQTQTIYDDLGRPRFSQDPRLEEETAVTYIRYDGQGRTIESGRLEWYQSLSDLTVHVNDQTFPDPALTALSERLFSYYDETNGFSPGVQENLRNRVVKTEYYESENALSHASHYDYDIQGNVKTLWQEDRNVRNPNGFIKRMDYTYGLVNGITYQFDYQAGQRDAYSHRYCYDDNNRLILSETSDGGGVWDVDQHNIYRYDGALARMEVGDYLVQGMDYVYTLQGWIKGVNSSANLPDRDLGNDGALSSTDPRNQLHRWLGRDAYAYTLHYNTTDYQSIHNFSATNRFYAEVTSANGVYFQGVDGPAPGLYNGNIAAMQTTLTKPDGQPEDYLLKGYYYDQLMRLRIARTAREPATAGTGNSVFINNAWEATAASTADYRVDLTYDRNGNIQSLQRNGYTAPGQSLAMDDLSYGYAGQNGFGLVNHQLNHVNDAIATSSYGTDLDDQNPNNYLYDRIGNLIRDNSEEIASIEWNIQGKVKRLTRSVGSQRPDLEYRYDSQGNRIEKIVKTKDGSGDLQPQYFWTSTHYVRDAQGNVLATYDKNYDRYSVDNATAIPDLSQFQNEVYLIRPGSGAQPPADAAGVPELILSNGQVPIGGTGNEYVEVMTWKEVHLYGSKRLGIEQKQSTVGLVAFTATVSASSGALVGTANREAFEVRVQEAVYGRTLGTKTYELANHLRNVLVVVSDRLLGRSADGLTVDGYEAQVLRSTDYYPFGMEMVGRTSGADAYRYGFNGKEDDRAWGNQLIQDYGFRLYNPAIAKFLSVDPLAPSYPMLTPYQFSSNRPIDGIDLEGLEYATVVYEIRYGSDEPSFRIEWHDDLQHNSYGRRGKGISVKTETYDENGSLISTSPTKFYKRSEKIALHSVDYGFYFGVTQVPEIKEIREYILTPVDAVDEAGRVHDRAYELVKANAKNATKSWATIEADEAFIIANKKVAARLVGDPDPFNQQPITLSEKKHARRAYQYFAWTRWNKIEAVSSWMMKNYSSIAKNDKGGFLGLNDIEENQLYNYEKFRDMYMYQDSNGDWLTKTDMWKTVGEGEDAYLVPKTVSELDSL